ncbi:malonyl-CoA decarboxylase domain-containing protein [Euzebya pacifica]|uniref:malonyl-CoA decarboxylase domain-containing protein n=1 Tax=Euzebya pacifica TaxID=1608957 RepID=UPI0030FB7B9C
MTPPTTPDAVLRQCEALLDADSEGVQASIAERILAGYRGLEEAGRRTVLIGLGRPLDPVPAAVVAAASAWDHAQTPERLQALLRATKPPRRELLRRLHLAHGATRALVDLRRDLLVALGDEPDLQRVDLDLRFLLRSWFTREFLELRRIDWTTPAFVLERIATNEAVHEVSDWLDLRARVRPSDRRCYGFFHPAMPDEPLIFVMVALTDTLPTTIASVLETHRDALPEQDATMAVFYSISNCQPGLRGVSLGNFLIKQVAATIAADLPQVTTFCTLSPITGLAGWTDEPAEDPAAQAAAYLVRARRDDGQPLDPVARFHLGNGAILDRILPDADPSPRGMQRAFGTMCSYRYDLDHVADNHHVYATDRTIVTGPAVDALLRRAAGR